MLIPQFSLRWVLLVTALCAVLSLIAAFAVRGAPWAMALTIGVVSLAFALAVHGAMFFAVWVFSLVVPPRKARPEAAGPSPLDVQG